MKFHPEIGDDRVVPLHLGLSIAWQNMPFQRGQAADYDPSDPRDTAAYKRLLAPEGRFFVVGDQVSPLPGWQEGAMMSAQYVIEQVAGRRARVAGPAVQTSGRQGVKAPASRDVSD